MQYKALLFDFNGTLVNDTDCHIQAWQQALQPYATIGFADMKAQWYGKNEDIIERILPHTCTPDQKASISAAKEAAYLHLFGNNLQPVEGLPEFLQWAQLQQLPMAVGSAASETIIRLQLQQLQLLPFFKAIISAAQVQQSKPHPETYITCATALQVAPHQCLVFEDTPKGIQAAQAAGMHAVALTTTHSPDAFHTFDNVVLCCSNYTTPLLRQLIQE